MLLLRITHKFFTIRLCVQCVVQCFMSVCVVLTVKVTKSPQLIRRSGTSCFI